MIPESSEETAAALAEAESAIVSDFETRLQRSEAAFSATIQALTASELRYRSTLDNFLEGCQLIGHDWSYLYLNEAAARHNRKPNAELLGRKMTEVWPGIEASSVFQLLQRSMTSREAARDEIEFVFPDGSTGWFEVHCQPVPEGIFALSIDISERKSAQEGLQRALDEMEERVRQRTAELVGAHTAMRLAKEQAEGANQAKSDFLSRMSHELRTPLNAILGFAQIMQHEGISPRQEECVDQILSGGKHLLGLINEVLDIARVEAGRLDLTVATVALAPAVREIFALLAPLADERGIRLGNELSAPGCGLVLADPARLKQVLLNLISNAIKYNCIGGEVWVGVRPREDGRVQLLVRDTGSGIATADLPKLFTPFERLGAVNSEVQGCGLGLALSKRLVDAMGGTLTLESSGPGGSTFGVELPGQARPEPISGWQPGSGAASPDGTSPFSSPDAKAAPTLEDSPARSVLCIEDNPSNLMLIEVIMAKRPDFTLRTATEGVVGLQLANQDPPDVILLDLNLPDITGEEVLATLQASSRTRDIPVIVVSADAIPHQVSKVLDSGATAYLTKPLHIPEFLRVLNEVLDGSQRQK